MSRTPPRSGPARPGVPGQTLTRRAALAGAGALALAHAGPAAALKREKRRPPPVPPGEPTVLYRLIGRENEAAAAYAAAPGRNRWFARLAEHELAHARALNSELAALGLNGPAPLRDAGGLLGEAGRLARAAGPHEARAAAIALERELLAVYAEAMRGLHVPNIVRTAATVMGSHGQHLAVLERQRLP